MGLVMAILIPTRRSPTINLNNMKTITPIILAESALTATARAAEEDFPGLRTYAYGQDRRILTTIEKQVRSSLSDASARALWEGKLVAVLESEATFDAKQFVCRQLRLVGSAKSVPALAKLLADPRLSGMARYALESNPDPAAAQALRDALKTTRGELLIGVINSVGQRRDRAAVPGLKAWLTFKDEQISGAAAAALGKIGGKDAMGALRMIARNPDPRLLDATLTGADSLVAEGEAAKAASIYRTIYRNTKLPPATRFAALRGWLLAEPDKAMAQVNLVAQSNDERLRVMAASLRQKPFTPGLIRK